MNSGWLICCSIVIKIVIYLTGLYILRVEYTQASWIVPGSPVGKFRVGLWSYTCNCEIVNPQQDRAGWKNQVGSVWPSSRVPFFSFAKPFPTPFANFFIHHCQMSYSLTTSRSSLHAATTTQDCRHLCHRLCLPLDAAMCKLKVTLTLVYHFSQSHAQSLGFNLFSHLWFQWLGLFIHSCCVMNCVFCYV